MCTTCGCAQPGAHIHTHVDENGNVTTHVHDGHDHEHHHHDHDHHHHHDHDHAHPEHAHAPGFDASRAVSVEEDILARNNAIAAKNRELFRKKRILALNLVSSPGSGKTELLCATLKAASGRFAAAVIEGDQQTANDAERIRATGAPALQINTGKGCHLDARMVEHALEHMTLADDSVLFIENVGNLVCPAEFDLGEAHKVAVLSVTEGEDKPLKYPDMFRAADVMIINKVDLLPYVPFDIEKCEAAARRVNPKIRILRTSATTGEGLAAWLAWIAASASLSGY